MNKSVPECYGSLTTEATPGACETCYYKPGCNIVLATQALQMVILSKKEE
jgi:hypothetical protein